MKKLLVAFAFLIPSLVFANVFVTPKVGYNFQTDRTIGQQIDAIGEGQKNDVLYGVSVGTDVGSTTAVELEYLQSESNVDSKQVGVNVVQNLGKSQFFVVGGSGYHKLSTVNDVDETLYVKAGGGFKTKVSSKVNLKTEASALYLTDNDQWVPQATIGLETRF